MKDDINLEQEIENLISRSPLGHAVRVLPAELEPELSFAFRNLAREKLLTEADASAAFQPDEFRDRLRARVPAITHDCMRLFDRLMQGVATEGGRSTRDNSCLCLPAWIESEIKEAVGTKIENLTQVRRQLPVNAHHAHQPRSATLQDGRTETSESPKAAPSLPGAGRDGVAIGDTSTVQRRAEDHRTAGENPAALGAASATTKQDDARPRLGKERKGDASLLVGYAVTFRTAEQYLGITERHRQNLVSDQILTVVGKGHNRKITTESLKNCLHPEIPK
jgi:hypothetical protein